jgi:hypothetical protein
VSEYVVIDDENVIRVHDGVICLLVHHMRIFPSGQSLKISYIYVPLLLKVKCGVQLLSITVEDAAN